MPNYLIIETPTKSDYTVSFTAGIDVTEAYVDYSDRRGYDKMVTCVRVGNIKEVENHTNLIPSLCVILEMLPFATQDTCRFIVQQIFEAESASRMMNNTMELTALAARMYHI